MMWGSHVRAEDAPGAQEPRPLELDARRAFDYLLDICRLGPRMSGSQGMLDQQQLLIDHFEKFGARVRLQEFDAPHPLTGRPVRFGNLIVSWDPAAAERVLVCCHYDTRPWPDRDRTNPRGRFIGANDGGSGVALLMELAHHMRDLKPTYGVDFVFFDAEEFVFSERDKYFLGSEHFAREYRDNPPGYRYRYGVLVDMIGDRTLTLYQETNSLRYAPELTASLWSTARRMGVRQFIAKEKHEVNDDHVPLNTIAGIPTCDIIDFDYPWWHTTGDVPSRCSGTSLVTVGRVLVEWLQEEMRDER